MSSHHFCFLEAMTDFYMLKVYMAYIRVQVVSRVKGTQRTEELPR